MTRLTRGQAVAAKCRECISDPLAAGTWREQVAVCACTDCPLWQCRPLSANAPPWIASRDAADLPDGFAAMYHDDAIATLRGNIAASANGCAVQAIRGRCERGAASGVAGRGDASAFCPVRAS